ncbi:MAG: hypothetical protein ACK5V3_01360 [Bdellovibrionales bacterium]
MKIFINLIKYVLAFQIMAIQSSNAQEVTSRKCTEQDSAMLSRVISDLARAESQLIEAQRLLQIEKQKGNYLLNRGSSIVANIAFGAAIVGGATATFATYQETALGGFLTLSIGVIIGTIGKLIAWLTHDPELTISIEKLETNITNLLADVQFLRLHSRNLCRQ